MTGKRVFWYFAAFFGVITAVNAVMMTLAVRTHSGVVTDHAYEKGLAYNNVVQANAAQEALGWKGTIDYQNGKLVFDLKDQSNSSVTPDKATATFTRPTKNGMDFTLELTGGSASVTFPAKGVWDVRVDATVSDKAFQQSKRIVAQ